jgi:hypothetical protein
LLLQPADVIYAQYRLHVYPPLRIVRYSPSP